MSDSFLASTAQSRADAFGGGKARSSGAAPLSPLSALERSMGLASVAAGSSTPIAFSPGGIESDADATPPAGRAAVHYGGDDSLFDSPSPIVANATVPAEGAAAMEQDEEAGIDGGMAGLFGALDETALGPGGDATALLAQLEAMAAEFERQSGEPETHIRGQIAVLRSVLDARPAAVAQSRQRMNAALQTIEMQRHTQPAAAAEALADRAAHSVCADSLASIEANMDAVGSALRDDPAAAAVVAQVLSGTK